MFKQASRIVDRMPFAGKYAIEPIMKGHIKSAPGQELRKAMKVSAFLGAYVVAHALQAKLGADAFSSHLTHFETTGDTTDIPSMGFDALYTAANAAVTLRQASLMNTVDKIYLRRQARYERLKERAAQPTLDLRLSDAAPDRLVIPTDDLRFSPESPLPAIPTTDLRVSELAPELKAAKRPFYKRRLGAVGVAVAFTLSGQAGMLYSMGEAAFENAQDTCVANADTQIHATARDSRFTSQDLERLHSQWSDYCNVSPSSITSVYPHYQTAVHVSP